MLRSIPTTLSYSLFLRVEKVFDPLAFYRLVAKHSGKCLDVSGGPAAVNNGAQVHQWDDWGGDNQIWRIEPVGDGYCRLVAKHSGKCLDIWGASQDAGAAAIQWDWHGGDNQRWMISA